MNWEKGLFPLSAAGGSASGRSSVGRVIDMCYVYVLRSLKNKKRYVGSTSKDVQERLNKHNQGSNVWTRNNGPFELVYADLCSGVVEVRKWELFLKSGQGRQCLDELGI